MSRSLRHLAPLLTPIGLVLAVGLILAPGAALAAPGSTSPDGVWREVDRASATAPATLSAPAARLFEIDSGALSAILTSAPGQGAGFSESAVLTLPVHGGVYERFLIQERHVFSPALAAQHPEIQSFVAQGVDQPALSATFVHTPAGFYAFIRTLDGMIYMEPNGIGNTTQSIAYTRRDVMAEAPVFECQFEEDLIERRGGVVTPGWTPGRTTLVAPSGATLSTYDLAVTTTGEFTEFFDPGGGTTNTLSQIAASVAAVNAIYGPEVTIQFQVTCNNVFTDPDTDPFATPDNSGPSLDENQASADANCGDYDIGHVFHKRPGMGTGFSGLAGGNACNDANKARGYSSVPNPVPTTMVWIVDQLCHEIGHQFTAGHTFNSDVNGCDGGNRSANDAYEPGSGSTIMAYAAAARCVFDFPGSNDAYFHGHSFDQVTNWRDGGGNCGDESATGNTPPTVDAGPDYTIPQGTPFTLTAIGNDADGGDVAALTYCWEQFDLGSPGDFATNVNGPLFRSRPPDPSPSRTFPVLSDLLAGNPTPVEILPLVDRTLNFRCTIRDNRVVAGGVNNDAMVVTVAGDPFFVTSPDGGETLHADCLTTITWTVGGGSVASNVDILLSYDGGASFSMLAANVANDGSHEVRLPCATTTQGRILIRAVDNIFFDVSDGDFSIVNDEPVASMDATGGSVGATCEFLVPFEAVITDDCRIDAASVVVTATSVDGRATVDAPVAVVDVVGPGEVRVTGTVRVSALTACPAVVRVSIEGDDECGLSDSDFEDVEVIDDTPPEISVVLSKTDLWPPNHKLHAISAEVTVSDNCPGVSYVLTSITSNEPENGLGDGDTAPDIVDASPGTADTEFQLRAERSGTGDGRVYTVTYTASDPCGNSADATAKVFVAHSKAGGAHALSGIEPVSGTVLPSASVVAYIVPGVPAYTDGDFKIVAGGATLGNAGGTVTALLVDRLHYDADASLDHLLVFDAVPVRQLAASGEPLGLLYHTTLAGAYLVSDALRLGASAASSAAVDDQIAVRLASTASLATGEPAGAATAPGGSGVKDLDAGGAPADRVDVTRLRGVQPNPFRGTTAFAYELAESGPVRLVVYTMSGRAVRVIESAVRPAGRHTAVWDGRDDQGRPLAPGIFIVRFAAAGVNASAKAVLVQ